MRKLPASSIKPDPTSVTLDRRTLDEIVVYLGARPYSEVAPLLNRIIEQVRPQIEAQNAKQPDGK